MIDERIYQERKIAKDNNIPILRDTSFSLLTTLVATFRPQRILEIGTAWGFTGISMLMCAPNSTLVGIEYNEDSFNKAKENYKKFGVEKRAKVFLGDAGEIIPVLSGEFDFIFLDGPKGHYYEYLENLLPLLKKGGVIFADNVLFNGYVTGENTPKSKNKHNAIINSLRSYLKKVTEDKNLKTTVLDIEDGVAITVKL